MSHTTVIGFESTQEGIDRETDFIRRINDTTVESLLEIARETEKSVHARIIIVRRMKSLDQRFGDSQQNYASVYFLNEAAADMCKDIELPLLIIGETDEMPIKASYEIQAYYLPAQYRKSAQNG
jgi:hypothetical protein